MDKAGNLYKNLPFRDADQLLKKRTPSRSYWLDNFYWYELSLPPAYRVTVLPLIQKMAGKGKAVGQCHLKSEDQRKEIGPAANSCRLVPTLAVICLNPFTRILQGQYRRLLQSSSVVSQRTRVLMCVTGIAEVWFYCTGRILEFATAISTEPRQIDGTKLYQAVTFYIELYQG